ncbi:MAG: anthranilate synthase component I [Chloroflexota bacterium]|nr:anthranilate synthase component I [Chloroflexota bacterium]
MYYPTLNEVKELSKHGNLVPVYREIVADLETPVSAFLKIADGDYAFLLESVEGGERLARYSFIGTDPYLVLRSDSGDGDPLVPIEAELRKHKVVPVRGLPPFHGGAVGYLSYETVRHFEELPSPDADPLGLPESVFMFADTVLVFDHLSHKIKVVSHARLDNGDVEKAYKEATERIDALVAKLNRPLRIDMNGATGPREPQPASSNISKEDFEAKVAKAKEHIVAGDIIQAVLSQRLSKPTAASPFDIYRSLRGINPSPYMYYLKLDGCHIIGTSPEMLVRVEDGIVSTHPIAGTRPRGHDAEQDAAYEVELKEDIKEQAEHIMLVDLGRNDIGRIAEAGSVEVSQFMDVERYSHVMHLVSHVQGRLRGGLPPFDALRACFPAGTVSGAPKIRAMEIIAEMEPDRRGPYAGAVGYFSFSGNLDTAITIRTIVMKDGTAHVQAGAGIVYDSVPEREHQECMNKAKALMKAIEVAEGTYVAADR